ncbi:MAG TPA: glycine betaine ABC transporter substrate-binding protein [Candidatus Baltobacteraceae bacterium]|jgi:osmoprotectant transport system substrate-binding protein|nr:glycine betaine ABC transporter substrate-binding protein [Candidatus Baltobacteraceae bacterium]
MDLSRGRALGLIASVPMLARCGRSRAIRVGSKNFTESIVVAEIYAAALEHAGIAVERRLDLGSTQIALAAMARGDIDLYPEYTGTALIDVLHHAPISDPREIYQTVKDAFRKSYDLEWLVPSPMNDSQGIATTRALADRYRLQTLSDLAGRAPQLRLATIPEFLSRSDGLPGLQRRYGGFAFKSVHTYDIALKYQALLTGAADVATAFTTDGTIASQHLVVLRDDKHLWPAYNVAPVVRHETLARDPRIAAILNAVSPSITDAKASQMNAAVEDRKRDPADVAAEFLKERR